MSCGALSPAGLTPGWPHHTTSLSVTSGVPLFIILIAASIPSPVKAAPPQPVQYRDSRGLTAMPHDFPPETEEIYCQVNMIPRMDYLEPFANLRILSVATNHIDAFPDLANVSTTLNTLRISENRLTSVPPALLNKLTALETLMIFSNQLTTFPDVPGPGNTLRVINIKDNSLTAMPILQQMGGKITNVVTSQNPFTEFDLAALLAMPNLELLNLIDIKGISMPNFCRWNVAALNLQMIFMGNEFNCDDSLVWMRLSAMVGGLQFLTHSGTTYSATCTLSNGNVVNLVDVAINDILERGDNMYLVKMDDINNYFCSLEVSRIIPGISKRMECGTLCLQDPDCFMFAHESNQNCVFAAAKPGDDATFKQYEWYSFQKR